MGTEKYPNEDEYSDFIQKNSGGSNAFTSDECTNYYFSVDNKALYGALDRFSCFFTCPLFLKDTVDREIQAVDNEHSKNLQSNLWRCHHFFSWLARKEHPFHHFCIHSLLSL